jgi:hypothetical protein
MKLIHAICAAAALLASAPAHAADPVWSMNAASCVPDSETIRNDRHNTSSGFISHRTGNVDLIRVICDVSNPQSFQGSLWNLVVTYRDSTGTGATANVLASLRRTSRTTGTTALVGSFNSNSSAAVAMNKSVTAFTHTFNFDTSYYRVEITLDRASTSEIVQAVGVAIEPGAE